MQVTIDPEGNVISSKILRGHPMLRYAALQAASRSKFEPRIFGRTDVNVSGAIYYNFLPKRWNWLEIGFTLGRGLDYYNISSLVDVMPPGFSNELQLLDPKVLSVENSRQTVDAFVGITRSKLSGDDRSAWLFDVGLTIARMEGNLLSN